MVTGGVMTARPAPGAREASRARLEIGVGAAVVAVIAILLAFALSGRAPSGTLLRATFAHVDGLGIGSDVKVAGVTVGRVTAEAVAPKTFLATVSFRIRPDIQLNLDSSAAILSDGLLGGKYLALTPGGDPRMLSSGGMITATQGSLSLDVLLEKFISNVGALMEQVKTQNARLGGPAKNSAPTGLDQ